MNPNNPDPHHHKEGEVDKKDSDAPESSVFGKDVHGVGVFSIGNGGGDSPPQDSRTGESGPGEIAGSVGPATPYLVPGRRRREQSLAGTCEGKSFFEQVGIRGRQTTDAGPGYGPTQTSQPQDVGKGIPDTLELFREGRQVRGIPQASHPRVQDGPGQESDGGSNSHGPPHEDSGKAIDAGSKKDGDEHGDEEDQPQAEIEQHEDQEDTQGDYQDAQGQDLLPGPATLQEAVTSESGADGQKEEDEHQREPNEGRNGLGAEKDQQANNGQHPYPSHSRNHRRPKGEEPRVSSLQGAGPTLLPGPLEKKASNRTPGKKDPQAYLRPWEEGDDSQGGHQ